MMNKYLELIQQTFDFPQPEFNVKNGDLYFHDIRMMDVIKEYPTPLKLSYLPKIKERIQYSKELFENARTKFNYQGSYKYAYCTKSSHFSYVLEEALKHDIHIETSSAYDMSIVDALYKKGTLDKSTFILCNGFKRPQYVENVCKLVNEDFNCIPILDTMSEFQSYENAIHKSCNLGIRVAADEEPNFEFYTSRLGIAYKKVVPFYEEQIKNNETFKLKMLHFFINTGIRDTSYYWNELSKFLEKYCELKKICPDLDTIDIGGGFPIKNWLGFEFDYQYMVDEIINNVQQICKKHNVPEPNIFTEFGSFTVGESGANLYSILDQKLQNDKELWYMIDSSFITTLPDTWGIGQRYILLPLNLWENTYQTVNLGGLTCDSLDYYNAETHSNQVFLPKINEGETLYVGMFHTGAYQESLGGFGGIPHCLIPTPKQVTINDRHDICLFSEEQDASSMLNLLGYNK